MDRHGAPLSEPGRILVVMPTLGKRLDTLPQALDSVRSQGVDVTIVVVTPPGATQARELAAGHEAVVVDDPRTGLSGAMNAGLTAASDEFAFAWLNDDDVMLSGGLSTLTRLLLADPGAVLAYGACEYIDDEGRLITVSRAGRMASHFLPWGPNLVPMPSCLTRIDAARHVGGFDEGLRFAMDLDLLLRLRREGRFVSTRESVAAFRWHADSLTVANRSSSVGEAEAVKLRYLPAEVRRLAPVWHRPVRWATYLAAREVSRRARRLQAAAPPAPTKGATP